MRPSGIVPGIVLVATVWAGAGAEPAQAQRTPSGTGPTHPDRPSTQPGPTPLSLGDLLRLGLENNPALRQAGFSIDAAQGRALQAGLPLNPTLSLTGEEIGRRGGIYTLPQLSQELQTAGKRQLNRSLADQEVALAQLGLTRQRYQLFTTLRLGFFELLTLNRRIETLDELVTLAAQSHENVQRLFKHQQIAELDVLPFQVELERLRSDAESARLEHTSAWGRLAASVGDPTLRAGPLAGSLEGPLPEYPFDRARSIMLDCHPEILLARAGIRRAQTSLDRERAQAAPNLTVGGGYQRNFNDRENEAVFQVSVPLPVWNRNQGIIRAAEAELGRAMAEVDRVQNDLTGRLWAAVGQYDAARRRVERYRSAILPAATRADQLSRDGFRGGQFEYLRVLQAQRALAEAKLEYIRALGDAWRGASEIAGLLVEDRLPENCLP